MGLNLNMPDFGGYSKSVSTALNNANKTMGAQLGSAGKNVTDQRNKLWGGMTSGIGSIQKNFQGAFSNAGKGFTDMLSKLNPFGAIGTYIKYIGIAVVVIIGIVVVVWAINSVHSNRAFWKGASQVKRTGGSIGPKGASFHGSK